MIKAGWRQEDGRGRDPVGRLGSTPLREPPPRQARENQQGDGAATKPRHRAAGPPVHLRLAEQAAVAEFGIRVPEACHQFNECFEHDGNAGWEAGWRRSLHRMVKPTSVSFSTQLS